jgi:hypothetical protein
MQRQPVVEGVGENDGSSEKYRDGDGLLVFVLRRGTKHGSDNDSAEHRRNS